MNCMRCGRETQEDQVFCKNCLRQMEQYPVDQDVVVQLPRRKSSAAPKRGGRRRTVSPEEQIAILRRRVRRLATTMVVMAVLCVLLAILAARSLIVVRYRPGQNYKTLPSSSSSATVSETVGNTTAGR